MASNTQRQRYAALAQSFEQQQEKIVGLDGCGPGHGERLYSNGIAAQYNDALVVGKAL